MASFSLQTQHNIISSGYELYRLWRDSSQDDQTRAKLIRGLEGRYDECAAAAVSSTTSKGARYLALSDEQMLACQEALPEHERKPKRIDLAPRYSRAEDGMNWDELKREEERKRDANYDPVLRWHHIQETITWAEQNLPPHLQRNRPANRVAEERRKNAQRDCR